MTAQEERSRRISVPAHASAHKGSSTCLCVRHGAQAHQGRAWSAARAGTAEAGELTSPSSAKPQRVCDRRMPFRIRFPLRVGPGHDNESLGFEVWLLVARRRRALMSRASSFAILHLEIVTPSHTRSRCEKAASVPVLAPELRSATTPLKDKDIYMVHSFFPEKPNQPFSHPLMLKYLTFTTSVSS